MGPFVISLSLSLPKIDLIFSVFSMWAWVFLELSGLTQGE